VTGYLPFVIPVRKRFPVLNQAVGLDGYRETLNFHENTLLSVGRSAYSIVQTALTSVYASSASWPISRPQPDCLYPPNGSAASNTL
jgi:hypothetical protein